MSTRAAQPPPPREPSGEAAGRVGTLAHAGHVARRAARSATKGTAAGRWPRPVREKRCGAPAVVRPHPRLVDHEDRWVKARADLVADERAEDRWVEALSGAQLAFPFSVCLPGPATSTHRFCAQRAMDRGKEMAIACNVLAERSGSGAERRCVSAQLSARVSRGVSAAERVSVKGARAPPPSAVPT